MPKVTTMFYLMKGEFFMEENPNSNIELNDYFRDTFNSIDNLENKYLNNKGKKLDVAGKIAHSLDVDMEKVYTEEEAKKAAFKLTIKDNFSNICIGSIYLIVTIRTIFMLIGMIRGAMHVDYGISDIHIFFSLFFLILMIGTWAFSTKENFWNYHNRKIFIVRYMVVLLSLNISQFLMKLADNIFIPLLGLIPIRGLMTPGIVIMMGRIILLFFLIAPFVFTMYYVIGLLSRRETKDMILSFMIRHYIDFRKNKEFAYDMKIVKYLDTGITHVIKEHDRFLHTMADGVTGTGKTSTCMTTACNQDLKNKVRNETYQKRELLRLLSEKKVVLNRPFDDIDFTINNFTPLEDGEKEFEELKKKVQACGITVLAPNASLTDEIYELATSLGLKVNRIDPVLVNGVHKEGFIGINPLYISSELTPLEKSLEVVKKAIIFADIMQAIYEMNGKGDPYFTGLNRSLTTSITILVLHTFPYLYPGVQPTLREVQEIINDFSKAKPYLDVFKNMLRTMSPEQLGFEQRDFQFIVDVFENKLLGEAGQRIFEQANGLQNQINEFLTNTLFSSALCVQQTVDLDRVLKNGEITVVNYALELGKSSSIAFGLFFAMNFNNAVIRRPVDTRIPHFYYADELAVLIHESWETNFTLFRQYNCAMFVAFQTLDQMNKTESTKYLMGVLLGNCAHQFLFGRLSPTEMERFEKMGGTKMTPHEQETISQTALSDINTSRSTSVRTTMQEEANVTGSSMRYRAFQEVTVYTVDEGSPLPPFYGKVNFLPKSERLKKKKFEVDWSKYFYTIKDQKLVDDYYNKKSDTLQFNRDDVMFNDSTTVARVGRTLSANPTEEIIFDDEPAVVVKGKNDPGEKRIGSGYKAVSEPAEEEHIRENTEEETYSFGSFEM